MFCLGTLAIIILLLSYHPAVTAEVKRPNVVIVLADDMD